MLTRSPYFLAVWMLALIAEPTQGQSTMTLSGGSGGLTAALTYNFNYLSYEHVVINPLVDSAFELKTSQNAPILVEASYSLSQSVNSITTSLATHWTFSGWNADGYFPQSVAVLTYDILLTGPGTLSIAAVGPAGLDADTPIPSSTQGGTNLLIGLSKIENGQSTSIWGFSGASVIPQLYSSGPSFGSLFEGSVEAGSYRVFQVAERGTVNTSLTFNPSPVPEPSSGLLVVLSGLGLACFGRHRKSVF